MPKIKWDSNPTAPKAIRLWETFTFLWFRIPRCMLIIVTGKTDMYAVKSRLILVCSQDNLYIYRGSRLDFSFFTLSMKGQYNSQRKECAPLGANCFLLELIPHFEKVALSRIANSHRVVPLHQNGGKILRCTSKWWKNIKTYIKMVEKH